MGVTAAGSGDNKVILAASGEGGRLIPVQISTSNGGARQITLAKPTTASRTIQIFKPASAATASPKGSKLQEALVHGKKQQFTTSTPAKAAFVVPKTAASSTATKYI